MTGWLNLTVYTADRLLRGSIIIIKRRDAHARWHIERVNLRNQYTVYKYKVDSI